MTNSFPLALALGGAAGGAVGSTWLVGPGDLTDQLGSAAAGSVAAWLAASSPGRLAMLEARLRVAHAQGVDLVWVVARSGAGASAAVVFRSVQLLMAHMAAAGCGLALAGAGERPLAELLPAGVLAAAVGLPPIALVALIAATPLLLVLLGAGLASGALCGLRLERQARANLGLDGAIRGLRSSVLHGIELTQFRAPTCWAIKSTPLVTLLVFWLPRLREWVGIADLADDLDRSIHIQFGQESQGAPPAARRDGIRWDSQSKFTEVDAPQKDQKGD